MSIDIRKIGAMVSAAMPSALLEYEDYTGSHWLNIRTNNRIFTAEANDHEVGLGFSAIVGDGLNLSGHDDVFVGEPAEIVSMIVSKISEATGAPLKSRTDALPRRSAKPKSSSRGPQTLVNHNPPTA